MVGDMSIPCSIILSGVQNNRKKVLKNGIDTRMQRNVTRILQKEYKFQNSGNGGDAGSYPSACGL